MNGKFCDGYERLLLVLGVLLAGVGLSGSVARGDGSDQVWAHNDYIPPLIQENFPHYPDVAQYRITILTDINTAPGLHSVTVVDDAPFDTDDNIFTPANVAVFNFTVLAGGTVEGQDASAEPSQWKDCDGIPADGYYATVIGVQPLAAYGWNETQWPFESPTPSDENYNYQFPPISNHAQFLLDDATGFVSTPANTDNEYLESDYYYNEWALLEGGVFDFLPNEGPYTHSQQYSVHPQPVFFALPGKARKQPYPCSPEGCHGCPGMAVASLDRFQAGVAITDTPISYTPGVGMNMAFTVRYHERLDTQPTTMNYSNLGPLWQGTWINYIADGPTNNSQSTAIYHAADGSQYSYGGYYQTEAVGLGTQFINAGDFQANDGWTHATLHYRQNPERYERWLPDGSVEIYAFGVGTAPNRYFFLTSITDPQGNVTRLSYDPHAAANGQARLLSVTDPTGSSLNFSYAGSTSLLISKVTRSNDGLFAQFGYANGQLNSITDTIGMTSSFQYASGTYTLSSMTTPYGTSTFSSNSGAGYQEADITNPLGQTERVEYQEALDPSVFPASEGSAPSADGLYVNNANLNHANSFYWSRRAMADIAAGGIATDSAAFYAKAQATHWAESRLGSIPVPLNTRMPLEARMWNNYPGQNGDDLEVTGNGTSTSPSAMARLLDDGTTQVNYTGYNANGLVTQTVDPVGRTTNYNYDTNGIDLLTVTQTNPGSSGGQDALSTMTYNSQHLPLTRTDASGQTTTLTYNGQGQVLTRTDPKSETTTMAYYPNGYLDTMTGPVTGATTSYTYDSTGRVHTVTDSEGYTVTNGYDNLDRQTSATYPDGTSDQSVYKNLDVWKTIDRQNRTTWNQYDAIREILQTTDPQGRTTKYSWCTCGGLSTLTDANGNVTTWNLDLQGRVTGKVYADSSQISYIYETSTSRLHSMTDARGNQAVYAYNVDNTLASTAYTPATGVATTPNVGFSYDPIYNRVTQMADGTGTTTYGYNPITGSVTTGAGRLASVSTPIDGTGDSAAVTYSYDPLGRVTGRTVDGGSTVSTTFDSLGRVTNMSNPLGAFTYGYVDTTGRLSSVTYPSGTGLSTAYAYFDNVGDQRLQDITNSKSGATMSKFDYTYNPVGTIATWTQQADSSPAVVNTLSYDHADQLTGDAQSGGASSTYGYGYDPAGNRLSGSVNSTITAGQFRTYPKTWRRWQREC
jgi:YD repeat-containing protein